MQKQLDFLHSEDELIVSALAAPSMVMQVLSVVRSRNAALVFADVDPLSGVVTRPTLEAAITSLTRGLLLHPVGSWLPVVAPLLPSLEPRGIHVLGVSAKIEQSERHWTRSGIAGIQALGEDLLRLDPTRFSMDASEFAAQMRGMGVSVRAIGEEGFAFEHSNLGRRYRRTDFPGAVAAASSLLYLPGWQMHRAALDACAFQAYRQESFDFMLPAAMARPVATALRVQTAQSAAAEDIAAGAPPRPRRFAAGSRR